VIVSTIAGTEHDRSERIPHHPQVAGQHPERLQVFAAHANGVKVSIMLEKSAWPTAAQGQLRQR
jgi:hypothetical protein